MTQIRRHVHHKSHCKCKNRSVVIVGVGAFLLFFALYSSRVIELDNDENDDEVQAAAQYEALKAAKIMADKHGREKYVDMDNDDLIDSEVDNHIAVKTKTYNFLEDWTSYDQEKWKDSPRIVIHAGPEKTASTSVQHFLSSIFGYSLRISPLDRKKHYIPNEANKKPHHPHSRVAHTNWVWPLGRPDDYCGYEGAGTWQPYPSKAYYPLGWIMGDYPNHNPEWKRGEYCDPAYFASLFRRVWEEGKNIVFGSEEIGRILLGLSAKQQIKSAGRVEVGEEMHVAPAASDSIDWLLNLLPWDDKKPSSRTSLRLDDIEVVIHHRTPKIHHIESLWRQELPKKTFQTFLLHKRFEYCIHLISPLDLALQFVRKGIKTTIISMAGVSEKDEKRGTNGNTGGILGVIACDILRIGRTSSTRGMSVCDGQGRLRDVPDTGIKNKKTNLMPKHLNETKLDQIDKLFNEYECGVWLHLQKYHARGTLRVLYPTKDLFMTCNKLLRRDDFSFKELFEKIRSIADE